MKVPVIDIGICSQCMGCLEVCPDVFQYNEVNNFVEVVSLDRYPVEDVDEAIKLCPEDCIAWEDMD